MDELSYESRMNLQKHMLKTFAWVFLGLLTTAAVAYLFSLPLFRNFMYKSIYDGSIMYISLGALVLQIVVVVSLSSRLMKLSKTTALIMYFIYALITGITFSILPYIYSGANIFIAFAFTSIIFVSLVFIGMTTKVGLTKYHNYIFAALITLVVASVLGLFLNIPAFDMMICYVGIRIFMVITVYDIQKMKQLYYLADNDQELTSKFAIYSALELYLDFINIFIYILRLLSRNRN